MILKTSGASFVASITCYRYITFKKSKLVRNCLCVTTVYALLVIVRMFYMSVAFYWGTKGSKPYATKIYGSFSDIPWFLLSSVVWCRIHGWIRFNQTIGICVLSDSSLWMPGYVLMLYNDIYMWIQKHMKIYYTKDVLYLSIVFDGIHPCRFYAAINTKNVAMIKHLTYKVSGCLHCRYMMPQMNIWRKYTLSQKATGLYIF